MMNLADRRVLAHQRPIAPPQLGHILHQHERAERFAVRAQRKRAEQDRSSAAIDLDAAWITPGNRVVYGGRQVAGVEWIVSDRVRQGVDWFAQDGT